jgi:hypothetical protein
MLEAQGKTGTVGKPGPIRTSSGKPPAKIKSRGPANVLGAHFLYGGVLLILLVLR